MNTLSYIAEEHLTESRIFITGNGYSLVKDALMKLVIRYGCTVDTTLSREHAYDYILVFGYSKKESVFTKQSSKQNPISRLKNNGKVLFVLSDLDKVPHTLMYEQLIIPATASYKINDFAGKILKRLFTSHPLLKDDPVIAKKKEPKKKVITESSPYPIHKKIIRFGIFLCTLICIPVIVYGGLIIYSLVNLRESIQLQTSFEKRLEKASAAKSASELTEQFGTIFHGAIGLFSQYSADAILLIPHSITQFSDIVSEGAHLENEIRTTLLPYYEKGETKEIEKRIPFIKERLSNIEQRASLIETSLTKLNITQSTPFLGTYYSGISQIGELRKIVSYTNELLTHLPDIAGFNSKRSYLVLLQNNFELRPTGGFIGSYASIQLTNGKLTSYTIEDVYEADGQLKGRVIPPTPISQHLNQPNWFLRDSNWHPDFAKSAQQALWFMDKETGERFDGVASIDLYVVRNILSALGGIYVPDYEQQVTAEDFFIKLQSDTHNSFFPGSNKKKDLVSSLARSLAIHATSQTNIPYKELLLTMNKSLSEKHILLYSQNQSVQSTLEKLGWAGRIVRIDQPTNSLSPLIVDYLAVIDANLGVNKVNYFVSREITTVLTARENMLKREVIVYYKNSSPVTTTLFGGEYKNYVRFILPENSQKHEVFLDQSASSLQQVDIEALDDKTSVGLLINVPAQGERKIRLLYSIPLPASKSFSYRLIAQKQPGTDNDIFVLKLDPGSVWTIQGSNLSSIPYLTTLSQDRLIAIDFKQ